MTARGLAAALTIVFPLGGCAPQSDVRESGEFFKRAFDRDTYALYRPDIQQGNAIDPEQLARLRLGMTREQVHYLLGNPVAENVFHKNQWHYIYYLIPGKGNVKRYRLILLFEEDRLVSLRKTKNLAELIEKPHKKAVRKIKSRSK